MWVVLCMVVKWWVMINIVFFWIMCFKVFCIKVFDFELRVEVVLFKIKMLGFFKIVLVMVMC